MDSLLAVIAQEKCKDKYGKKFDIWKNDHWHRKDDRANQITNKYGKIRMSQVENKGNNRKPSEKAEKLKENH